MLIFIFFINILFLFLSILFISYKKDDKWWFYLPIFIYNLFYIGYVIFPVFFGYFLGFSEEQFLITEEIFFSSLAMHFLFYTFFISGYLFNKPITFKMKIFEKRLPNFISWSLCAVIIIMGLVTIPTSYFESYGESQRLVLEEFNKISADNIFYYPTQFFYSTLVFLIAVSYKDMVNYKTKDNYNYLFYISITMFSFVVLLSIFSGKRQFLFHTLMLLFFSFSLLVSKKKSFKLLLLSIVCVSLISPILLIYRSKSSDNYGETVQAKIYRFFDATQLLFGDQSTIYNSITNSLSSISDRGDSVTNGAVMYDYLKTTNDFAYDRPYYGVLFSFIPRAIWTEKPVPGSKDGTYYGTIPFLLGKIRYGSDNLTLTAHGPITMYWQFGWIGVIFGGLLSGFFMGNIIKICYSLKYLGGIIVMLTVVEKTLFSVGPSLDNTLKIFFHLVLPSFLLLYMLSFFFGKLNNHRLKAGGLK
jgi:hypothetical protein